MDNLYAMVDPATGKILPVKGVDNGDGTSSLSAAIGGGVGNVPMSLEEVGGTAMTLGQKTSSASFPVVLSSDQPQLQVESPAAMVTVSITRPADTTAYAAGDVVGAASAINTFASFGAAGDNMLLTTAIFRMDVAAVPIGLAALRLHLYGASPTAIADNAVFNLVAGDRANYLGFIDIAAPVDLGDTLYSQNVQINKHIKLAGTSLFAVLQTMAAFTPASAQVFSLSVGGVKL